MGKKKKRKNLLHGVRIQLLPQAFLALTVFEEKNPGDEARSDCGRVVHVYEKYFLLAIQITFLNLNSV